MYDQESKSLGDLLRRSCKGWGERPAMLMPQKKDFVPLTYSELYEKVFQYASVLRDLGMKRGDRLVILSESCPEWAITDWACQTLGIVVVPVYPTLPTDQAAYIASDCGAKIAVCSSQEQQEKLREVQGLKTMLLKSGSESLEELSQEKGQDFTKEQWEAEIDATQADDLATIIYTSGTTGAPKGAMLTHRAFTFLCNSALFSFPVDQHDVFLSFLPMSHVFERFAGQILPISCGACIAYSKSLMSLSSELQTVRPTIMMAVPRFLEATMDKILDSVRKSPPLRQKMFKWALNQGKKKMHGEFAPLAPLADALVGKQIRERTGGRIKFFVAGGAALSPNVAEFYRAFGLNVLQGYGLTETCAATCVNHPDRNRPDTVGEPLKGMDVKIAEDGEILVRGPARMMGYYNLPEETNAAIDDEGWFHTGDIGEFWGSHLKITDRKKDLLILANGKNIAPQPIESTLKSSAFIEEAVVLGDGEDFVTALIVPNFEAVTVELGSKIPSGLDSEQMIQEAAVNELIKSEISKYNKQLADFEKVKRHALLPKKFTIESGELTPTLKVKRKVIKDRYSEFIKQLYPKAGAS